MKKGFMLIILMMLINVLPSESQIWIHFDWNKHYCRECNMMCEALHLSPRAGKEYMKIIHKYGKKIEREALRDYRYWDRSAERIYRLRMDRDIRLQHFMTPGQFRLYIKLSRNNPRRIHDYRGWYMNPNRPTWHPTYDCYRWEDSYWDCHWDYRNGHWHSHFDMQTWRPPHNVYRPNTEVRPSTPYKGKTYYKSSSGGSRGGRSSNSSSSIRGGRASSNLHSEKSSSSKTENVRSSSTHGRSQQSNSRTETRRSTGGRR